MPQSSEAGSTQDSEDWQVDAPPHRSKNIKENRLNKEIFLHIFSVGLLLIVSHSLSWKGNLWVRCDCYLCQGLCCFDFSYICVVQRQWYQSLWEKTVQINNVNLLKQNGQFSVQDKVKCIYLTALPFLHPVPPLCLCPPVVVPKPRTPCSMILLLHYHKTHGQNCILKRPGAIFLPGNALPTSLSEGRTLLFHHTSQRRHHTSLQQLHKPFLHIGRCILTHDKAGRLI